MQALVQRHARILLVCRANLCRSPMALAVCAQLLQQLPGPPRLQLASAGTHAAASSRRADLRAIATLHLHGYPVPRARPRAVLVADFKRFDQILAMDRTNLADLQALCPPQYRYKLRLFLQGVPGLVEQEIPDPYFGALAGFERVLRLCEAGARSIISA